MIIGCELTVEPIAHNAIIVEPIAHNAIIVGVKR